jgi:hypothetical protein
MDLALYKEFYEHEWQRHEHLQSAVNTPISIVTLLAGGLVLMAKDFEAAQAGLSAAFWGLCLVATVLVGSSIYFNRFLVYALCATTSTAVPAGIAAKTTQPRPQEIRITNRRSDAGETLEQRNSERAARYPTGRRSAGRGVR